jgi:hypothetical protein
MDPTNLSRVEGTSILPNLLAEDRDKFKQFCPQFILCIVRSFSEKYGKDRYRNLRDSGRKISESGLAGKMLFG